MVVGGCGGGCIVCSNMVDAHVVAVLGLVVVVVWEVRIAVLWGVWGWL